MSVYAHRDNTRTSVQIDVALTEDFKPRDENWGAIEIKSIYVDEDEDRVVFWDNIDWFLENDDEFIKKECKQELLSKGLHYKGIFKDIRKGLDALVQHGYLKNKTNDSNNY